jgi:lipopolysaccharide biosynthesis regulator YciM
MSDEAIKRIQDTLKKKLYFDAEKMELTYALGTLFEKMGKKEEAIEQFKQVYAVDCTFKDVSKKINDYYSLG